MFAAASGSQRPHEPLSALRIRSRRATCERELPPLRNASERASALALGILVARRGDGVGDAFITTEVRVHAAAARR
jgi:hypothetical protein